MDNLTMSLEADARAQYLGTNPSADTPIMPWIFVSCIVHCLIFYFLPVSITPFIKSYILSTIHACVCVVSVCVFYVRSSVNLSQINRILGGGIQGTNDETITYNICYTSGYFVYDLLLMACYKSVRTRSALIHHLIVLIAGIAGAYTHVAHASHFLMLAEELSTIPLNLKTIYHHQPRIRDVCALLFAFTFLLTRLIYGTIITVYTFRAVPKFIQLASKLNDRTSIMFVIAQVCLFILTRLMNLYWAILIVRKVYVTFRKNKLSLASNSNDSKKKIH